MDADGKSDPYIKIDVDGHSLQQTKIQPKTLNPQWDEKFIFILEPQQVLLVFCYVFSWSSCMPVARNSRLHCSIRMVSTK
jgi:Ca2+-dependent lipid-binding protein